MSSKTEDYITRDIEAQNDCEHEEREAERAQLDRIKSSGVLTISPELFEKVHDQIATVLIVVVHSTQKPRGRRLQATICQSNTLGFHGVQHCPIQANTGSSSQRLRSPWS